MGRIQISEWNIRKISKKKSKLLVNKKGKHLQSRTKLPEKVFPIMSTFLRNKTISKTTPSRKENPFPQFNVASHKRPGIRLSSEYITTLLSGEGGEGRTGTATMFRKMLFKYTIFSTVLSKIVAFYFPISTISCKISPRIKSYGSKYPSRMNSSLKFVNFLTLDIIMNDEWQKFEESRP